MLPRLSFLFLLCLVVTIAISSAKPQNSSTKPVDKPKPHAGQSLVVNNNCGLANTDREMFSYIKTKVDYIAAQSGKGSLCSDGWVPHGKSCYLIIDIPTLEWNAARRNCQKLGGDLAKITSTAENQFIFGLLMKQTKVMEMGAWLGIHRKTDNRFYWADGTSVAGGYTAWDTNEPGGSEKCGHIMALGNGKGKWNDWLCSLDKSQIGRAPVVLCQKKI